MSAESIKAIICDHKIDVDETAMFNMLTSWVKQDEANIKVGKRLVAHIQLCYMKADRLKYVVRKYGFVAGAGVDTALQKIVEVVANKEPIDKVNVRVTRASLQEVNGIYVRLQEDITTYGQGGDLMREGGQCHS